ncbi:MAG TPA: tetratricopeptide repeat protein [Woeseiaceae bacterium]|nr:tetratricopeptide repeat protein [Woeseiaceae bacterium]
MEESSAAGLRIGPYRIVRVLGSGGMGIVYLAERADESFRQQVAIKLVRDRLVDPETEERLLGERQILANLDHPNIARLLDGGATAEGTPYLVMEYIDGVPIDRYCDSRRLSIDERLHLFRLICSAVHYAHQNLVVHRDIKCTNILVTRDGVPKLLDFGIAKLLDPAGMPTAGLTRQGVLMLTPENAAPEQVLDGPITTATDTYALGLLLYRLLCGHPPYRLHGSHREIAEAICGEQPRPPSAMVDVYWKEPETRSRELEVVRPEIVARYRSTSVDKLRRRLKGDLDNIALKALRKEPARRYRSVHELSEDLRLHQAFLPVTARPDTWRYRAGKFMRRHVAGLGMAATIAALLVAFGATVFVQNQRIAEERDTAMEVSRFLAEIFTAPDPWNARGSGVTAREILERGADRISTELQGRPGIQAMLMQAIGSAYYRLGDYDPAIAMLERSLELRRDVLGEGSREVAGVKNDLAAVLIRVADYDRARKLLEEALEQHRREEGEDGPSVAASLFYLADLARLTGDLAAAERFASESLAIWRKQEQQYPGKLAEATSALARILRAKGDLATAERHYREAIAFIRERFGDDYPSLAYPLQNLAVVLREQGRFDEAEAMFRQALELARRVFGDDHDVVAGSLVMLGALQHERGALDMAEASFREALELHTSSLGPAHPFVAYDMTSMAMLCFDEGRLDEAEALLRDAVEIYEQSVGPDHLYLSSALTELGIVLVEQGAAERALPLFERALSILRRTQASAQFLEAGASAAYGHALAELGRYDEAEGLLLESVPRLVAPYVPSARRGRLALGWLASLYEGWDRPEEAARYREQLASLVAEAR